MVERRQIFGGFGNSLFQYAYLYSQFRKGEIPDIYVQDESYFKEYKDELRALYGQGLTPTDMVSIHVRRGDYLDNPFYVDLTQTDYYKNAMKEFPGAKFLVFCADRQEGSDDEADMEWCRENFQGREFEFFRGETELDDFNAMASCKAHIIANSSFSFWAAYVSGNRTIYPSEWYSDGVERTKFTPGDNWKKI